MAAVVAVTCVAMALVVVRDRTVVKGSAITLPRTSVVSRELATYVLLTKFAVRGIVVTLTIVKHVWAKETAKTVQDMAHVMSALAVIACVLRNAVKTRIAPILLVRSV